MKTSNAKAISAVKRSLKDLMNYQCEIDTRVMELEDTLDSIGTGGVEPLKPQPQAKLLTDYQIEQLAHRTCWRYLHDRSDKADHIYTFDRNTLLEFARKLREGGTA